MEKAVAFRVIMNGLHRGHPAEDALERFLMDQSAPKELEIIETHILSCEACVTRLEALELDMLAMKTVLRETVQQDRARQLAHSPAKVPAWAWLFGHFNWQSVSLGVGTLAACATALTFVYTPRDINVSAFRGSEVSEISTWHPLHLHLAAQDLPPGAVAVSVLDQQGATVWKGSGTIQNGRIDVNVPRLSSAGNYLVRVSTPTPRGDDDGLLREFSLRAR